MMPRVSGIGSANERNRKRIEGENIMKTILNLTAVLALAGSAFASQAAPAPAAGKATPTMATAKKKVVKKHKKEVAAPTAGATTAPAAKK